MQVQAKLKYASISAQKVRLIADKIRGLKAEKAMEFLRFDTKKASDIVKKVLDSAIANAEHNQGADIDELHIAKVFVDDGPSSKRFRARARGRVNYIKKRSSHITVVVSDTRGES